MYKRKQQITPEKNTHDQPFGDHTFIRDKLELKRKECHRYVPKVDSSKSLPSKNENPLCYCGEIEKFKYHLQANKSGNATSEGWEAAEAIQCHGTNAFGEISFLPEGEGERKPSKYVRLADDTQPDVVIRLLRDFWKLFDPKKPSLVITVIGGAKNFKLDGKKRVIFNKGLINAAQSTSAWIITSGCNMGVMKAVGEALAEGQTFHWDKTGVKQTLKCIGIAPWGYVENRNKLESREKRYKHAQYFVNHVIRHGKPVSLNPNHTHFLLVDDGVRGKYQGVAEFRAKLEKKISQPENQTGLGIPVVLMVVEGGYDAIEDVKKSLENKIPVVVCEGTGRAADILAYAYRAIVTSREQKEKKKMLSSDHEKVLKYKLSVAFGETWKDRGGLENHKRQINKFKEMVIQCCENEKLITVFDMNKHEEELDVAILSALLKGQGDCQSNIKQLELALTWNRSDVAEEKIFNQDVNFPEEDLARIMTAALKEDKVDFVRLAIQNGVIPKKFLTRDKLKDLYFEGPKASVFRQLLAYCNQPTTKDLVTVANLMRHLIGKAGKSHCEVMKDDESQNDAENAQPGSRDEPVFKHPYKELFLWAIFMNQQKMAKYLWQQGSEPLPSALTASWIFGVLARKLPNYESDLITSYEKNKEEFEQLAIKVLEECHSTDPEKAGLLLKKKNLMWGGMTCLELAADAKDRAFLSTVCCQNSLNEMWQRGIQSHWIMVLLALFFPPMIAALKFQPIQDRNIEVRDDLVTNDMSQEPMSLVVKPIEKSSLRQIRQMKAKTLCWNGLEKISTFYGAPVTKFSANLVTFTLFLVLYSYMLLFDFHERISITEWAMLAWMLTMFVEEIREMFFASAADTVKEKLKEWWQFSIFNRIDLLIFILALIGFILRWFPKQFQSSKTIYCINCAFLFVRILRFYSASSSLGPKLLMMTKMIKELFLFLMVFLVVLVAYGITTQTMMYGEREPYGLIFRDIFYYGYWQLFGQLFIDEMQGFVCDGTGGTLSHGAPCPNSSWLVTVLTVLYLLIANVLLMNILIAIFNHVFDEIQSNSIEFWKYGMYFLVVEFETKPRLAPPFIIIEHLFLVIKFIFKTSCCHTQSEESETSKINEVLVAMERECRKQYLQKQKNSENENSQKKIRFIESRVDDVAKMLEEDRILEEQKYCDWEGPITPRHRSPNHSIHEADVNAWLSQDRVNNSADDVTLPLMSMQAMIPSVGNGVVRTKDLAEDKKALLNNELHYATQSRISRPQVVVEMASDDEDQKEIQVVEMRHKRKTNAGKKSREPANVQNNLDEGSSAEARKQTSMSWEKHILQDSDGDVAKLPVAQPFTAFVPNATGNAINFAGMSRSLRGIEDRISGLEGHLSDVVCRLVKIEEKAERSLYNIESLLRNAVFYQGMRNPLGHDNQGFNT